jgi:hypothetical protein
MANAFLTGSKINTIISSNATSCVNNLLYFYYFALPSLPFKYYYGDMNDDVYNTSILITNASLSLMECTQIGIDTYNYVYNYGAQFNYSYTTYSLAFFQYAVSEMFVLQNMITVMQTDQTNGNYTDLLYQYGKLFSMLLSVQPLMTESDMDYFLQESPKSAPGAESEIAENLSVDSLDNFMLNETFMILMNFSIGFVNSTQIMDATIFEECRDLIENQWVLAGLSLFDNFFTLDYTNIL